MRDIAVYAVFAALILPSFLAAARADDTTCEAHEDGGLVFNSQLRCDDFQCQFDKGLSVYVEATDPDSYVEGEVMCDKETWIYASCAAFDNCTGVTDRGESATYYQWATCLGSIQEDGWPDAWYIRCTSSLYYASIEPENNDPAKCVDLAEMKGIGCVESVRFFAMTGDGISVRGEACDIVAGMAPTCISAPVTCVATTVLECRITGGWLH